MDTLIMAVFDTEEAAYGGAAALRDLNSKGDVVVYSAAVISKDENGHVAVKDTRDEGPIGTAFGMMLGAMVGVLAGPAAVASGAAVAGTAAAASAAAGGMAFGGVTGGFFGMIRDLYVAGVDLDVLGEVKAALDPGKAAVVASIDEVRTTPLDVAMKEAGGTLYRRARHEVVDEMFDRDIAAMDAEWDVLEAEWQEASDDVKASIKAKSDHLKERMTKAKTAASKQLEQMEDDFNDRMIKLDAQINNSVAEARERLEKRKAKLKQNYDKSVKKLKQSIDVADAVLDANL